LKDGKNNPCNRLEKKSILKEPAKRREGIILTAY
jgi:hypothetical protein